jgi:hypothetical protein
MAGSSEELQGESEMIDSEEIPEDILKEAERVLAGFKVTVSGEPQVTVFDYPKWRLLIAFSLLRERRRHEGDLRLYVAENGTNARLQQRTADTTGQEVWRDVPKVFSGPAKDENAAIIKDFAIDAAKVAMGLESTSEQRDRAQSDTPPPSSHAACEHDWFDCSNSVVQAPTKSCRKCGWTVHGENEQQGLFIEWPWIAKPLPQPVSLSPSSARWIGRLVAELEEILRDSDPEDGAYIWWAGKGRLYLNMDGVTAILEAIKPLARPVPEKHVRGLDQATIEACARLIKENIIMDTSAGKVLAPRQDGNRDGLHYATAILALATTEGSTDGK